LAAFFFDELCERSSVSSCFNKSRGTQWQREAPVLSLGRSVSFIEYCPPARQAREQVDSDVMCAVASYWKVECFCQPRDLHKDRHTTAIGDIGSG